MEEPASKPTRVKPASTKELAINKTPPSQIEREVATQDAPNYGKEIVNYIATQLVNIVI